jgi:hypothetical protein
MTALGRCLYVLHIVFIVSIIGVGWLTVEAE